MLTGADTLTAYYTAVVIITVMSMAVFGSLVLENGMIPVSSRRAFLLSCAMVAITSLAEWGNIRLNGSADEMRAIHYVIKCVELILAPVIPFFVAAAVRPVKKKYRKYPFALCAVHAANIITSVFTGHVFFLDEANVYQHGPMYEMYIVAYASGFIFMLCWIKMFSARYQRRNSGALVLSVLTMLFGVCVQLIDGDLRISWMAVAFAMTYLYIYYVDIVSSVDALTLLLNRSCFERTIRTARDGLVIVALDIDRFKDINDRYGHGGGDEMLSLVAKAIRNSYGKYGYCYRTGGDEFCVLIPIVNSRRFSSIEKLNRDFFEALLVARKTDDRVPFVSIGYVRWEPGLQSVSEALNQADSMMYEYKRAHRDMKDRQ